MPTLGTTLLQQLQSIKGGVPLHVGTLGKKSYKIKVAKLGELVFPLNKIQTDALIRAAQVAPFGKGHRTLVDETVRKTWEIDAEQLDLSSRKLRKQLHDFMEAAIGQMGITADVEIVPYKLLIYEPGGFFLEHQDSEKLPGMFGTLLVGLPSAHTGGAIRIDPGDGERVTVDFSADNAADFPAVAFFADRKHEILPVTEGHRVVLVCNLAYAEGHSPEPFDDEAAVQELAATLDGLRELEEPLVLALDHQYTNSNFSTAQLKGNDVARVAALRRAARRAGMEIRVGLIEEHESAAWENGYDFGQDYGSRYRRRGRGWYYDDEQEREPTAFDQIELGEVYDDHYYISHWLPEDGPDMGSMNVDPERIVTGPNHKSEDPIEWSVEGYQGNWGMTAEYTYRYAGVLLWHPSKAASVLDRLPLTGQLSWLETYVEEARQNPTDKALRRKVQGLLEGIRAQLEGRQHGTYQLQPVVQAFTFLGKLRDAPDEQEWKRWEPIFFHLFQSFPAESWGPLLRVFGHEALTDLIMRIGTEEWGHWPKPSPERVEAILETIAAIEQGDSPKARLFARQWLESLPKFLAFHLPEGNAKATLLRKIFATLKNHTPEPDWTDRVSAHLLQRLDRPSYLHETLGEALILNPAPNPLSERLHAATVEKLRERTAARPRPYPDLTRPLPAEMPSPAGPYKDLMQFLIDPKREVYEYRKAQAARTQLERYISSHQLDLDGVTIKRGSPHTLKLTKNDQSFHRAVHQFELDAALLERLLRVG